MITPLNEQVQAASTWVRTLRAEIGKVIVGQEQLVDRLLVGLLANGHVLLEGVPGLAKTLSVRTLAAAIQASFHRIQFTPDLLPADIVGTLIYSPHDGKYHATRGWCLPASSRRRVNRAPAGCSPRCSKRCRNARVTLGGGKRCRCHRHSSCWLRKIQLSGGDVSVAGSAVGRFMFKVLLGLLVRGRRKILDRMAFTAPSTSQARDRRDEIQHTRKSWTRFTWTKGA